MTGPPSPTRPPPAPSPPIVSPDDLASLRSLGYDEADLELLAPDVIDMLLEGGLKRPRAGIPAEWLSMSSTIAGKAPSGGAPPSPGFEIETAAAGGGGRGGRSGGARLAEEEELGFGRGEGARGGPRRAEESGFLENPWGPWESQPRYSDGGGGGGGGRRGNERRAPAPRGARGVGMFGDEFDPVGSPSAGGLGDAWDPLERPPSSVRRYDDDDESVWPDMETFKDWLRRESQVPGGGGGRAPRTTCGCVPTPYVTVYSAPLTRCSANHPRCV